MFGLAAFVRIFRPELQNREYLLREKNIFKHEKVE
jgi:hypothetical protein